MTIMDFKGVSWVGDMYQKFEAMCAEAEEVMYEDTLKYVENQVRTVGQSVKKFYSDVMQDLLPPSSLDPVKVDNNHLTVMYHSDAKMSKEKEVDDENELVSAASEQLVKDFDGAAARKDSIDNGSCCSMIYNVIKPCEPASHNLAGERCVKKYSQSPSTESVLSNLASAVAIDSDCRKDSQNVSLFNFPSISTTIANNSEVVSFNVLEGTTLEEASKPSYDADIVGISREMTESYRSNFVKANKTRKLSSGHLSTDSDGHLTTDLHEISSSLLAHDIRSDTDQTKLEESCVLVEKNDDKLAVDHVQKSYKKKIQNVFSPRRWSKSKRDQEQLAAWYEEKMGKNLVSTPIMQAKIVNSQTFEPFESDWELL